MNWIGYAMIGIVIILLYMKFVMGINIFALG